MEIYLLIEGKQEGPFTEELTRESLADSSISPDLPAWREGLTTWTTVGELLDYSPKPASQAPPAHFALPTPISFADAGKSATQISLYRWIVSTPLRIVASVVVVLVSFLGLGCTGVVAFAFLGQTATAPPASSNSPILEALQQDAGLSKQYHSAVSTLKGQNLAPDDFCDQHSQLIDRLVTAMKNIDMSGCPDDFRQAYLKHIQAWHEFGQAFAGHPHITSDGEGVFGTVLTAALTEDADSTLNYMAGIEQQNNDFVNTLKEQSKSISDSWNEVQSSALAYGIKPSDYQ